MDIGHHRAEEAALTVFRTLPPATALRCLARLISDGWAYASPDAPLDAVVEAGWRDVERRARERHEPREGEVSFAVEDGDLGFF